MKLFIVCFFYFIQGFLPVIVTIICLAVDSTLISENFQEPRRPMTLNMFTQTTSFVESETSSTDYLLDSYMQQFKNPYKVRSLKKIQNI